MSEKNIFCVSLVGREQVKANAILNDDGILVITELQKISGFLGSWKKKLQREFKRKTDDNYQCVIECRSDDFDEYALKLLLSDADLSQRRSYTSIAFDHYFNLLNMQSLVLGSELERHAIRDTHVNIVTDDHGRQHYDIDQRKFTGYQRAILLCVLVACELHQLTPNYVEQFMAGIGGDVTYKPEFATLHAIRNHYERDSYKAIE